MEQEQAAMITGRAERAQAAHAVGEAMTPLGKLGWWSMRHRRLVVAGWIVVLVAATAAGRLAGAQFKTDLTGGNTQSQQAATGRVITSAAAIMICVFTAFVLGDLRVLRVIGLGMAVTIFLDATLVRMAAMPAALRLIGRAAWWFPRWLDRTIPALASEARAELAPAVLAHPGGGGTARP
jgi:uncharacterized membrane protein YdfJ with MMPL/SSD domain